MEDAGLTPRRSVSPRTEAAPIGAVDSELLKRLRDGLIETEEAAPQTELQPDEAEAIRQFIELQMPDQDSQQ